MCTKGKYVIKNNDYFRDYTNQVFSNIKMIIRNWYIRNMPIDNLLQTISAFEFEVKEWEINMITDDEMKKFNEFVNDFQKNYKEEKKNKNKYTWKNLKKQKKNRNKLNYPVIPDN